MKQKNNLFKVFLVAICTVVLLIMILAACSSAPSVATRTSTVSAGKGIAPPMPAPAATSFSQNQAESATVSSDTVVTQERRIVRTGNISLLVESIENSLSRVNSIAAEAFGYVVNSRRSGEKEFAQGYISIRIPVEKFDDTLQKLRAMALKVNNENQQSQDVTQEYVDVKAQLANLEATEKQFQVILTKAQTVDDILKVQRELSRVRGDIERTKARVLYLERTSDTSLIEVTLEEPRQIAESGWSVLDTIKSAASGVVEFGRFLIDIVIWLIFFVWLWLPTIFIIRFWLKRRKKTA